MVYFLLSALTLALVVTGFNRVYCYHGIDQAYLGLYKGLFEEAVVVMDGNGAYLPKPQFYLLRLRYLLEDYFEVNLTPYCRSYTYDVVGDKGRISLYANSVTVTFLAKINDLDSKRKEAVFSIERGDL